MQKRELGKKTRTYRTKEGSPTFFLRGENLEYYRNIEYLKDVTLKANALLDRSNAKYENILDDQKLGYRVRARSSDSLMSGPLETEGKCKKCGLSHGAADFCIVEQIMDNERQIEDQKRKSKGSKSSWKSFLSFESKIFLKQHSESAMIQDSTRRKQQRTLVKKVNALEKMTPSQVLDTYEMLTHQYGANAGQRFLLANKIANPPEKETKIEPWTTECSEKPETKTHFEEIRSECILPYAPAQDPLCPGISKDVKEKMQEQVRLIPPCEGRPLDDNGKNWRAVFHTLLPQKVVETYGVEVAGDLQYDGSFSSESCTCRVQECACGSDKICTTPKSLKKCEMVRHDDDNDNNYLLTIRKKIMERRQARSTQAKQPSSVASQPQVRPKSRSGEFLDKANREQYKSLRECLGRHLKGTAHDRLTFNQNVQKIVDRTSPHEAFDTRQWDHWLEHMKEQEIEEDLEDIDTLPSDILTDDDDNALSPSSEIIGPQGNMKPSRIPCGDEIYELIDNLYEKISSKFEKSVTKNSFKANMLNYTPTYAFFHRKISLLSCQNPELAKLTKFPLYLKRLAPYHIRRKQKEKRAEALQRNLTRTVRRRSMIKGLQQGKKYRKVSQPFKYKAESGYKGFKPQERKLLDQSNTERFAKTGFAKDPHGMTVTTKKIHHDYMVISKMFEDAANAKREDLMDEGMLRRLREFQWKRFNMQQLPYSLLTDSEADDEGYANEGPPNKTTNKQDIVLLQAPNLAQGNLPKQTSCEGVLQREELELTKQRNAGKSNSADELLHFGEPNRLAPITKLANRCGQPLKSTSSTNVKGEKTGHKNKTHQNQEPPNCEQNLQIRCSVKSLTNLLPPLKGPKVKSKESNEFEETITLLQKELSNLLIQSQSQEAASIQLQEKANETKRNSTTTNLPKLRTPSRKTGHKLSTSKKRNDSLPNIKPKESVENVKPKQEKPTRKDIGRKPSTLNVRLDGSDSSVRLPRLVDAKLGSHSSNELLPEKTKSASKSKKIKLPTIPKHAVKAWR